MERKEIVEQLHEYRDAHSPQKLVDLLAELLIEELEEMPADSSRQKHNLNMTLRDLEEELDWIESEKLSEFEPEHE